MRTDEKDTLQALRWAAQNFAVDQVTAEVVGAFKEVEIESILLKGPTLATWLYANEGPRLYADTDLLIQRRDWQRARRALSDLGFQDSEAIAAHPRMDTAESTWTRLGDDSEVDLHNTLFGLEASPDAVWEALRAGAVLERVGGVEVLAPPHHARLLHIALHAVQHSGEDDEAPMVTLERRPMVDLERAIAMVPRETWVAARELAERLDGEAVFAAGLSLTADGAELAKEIGVRAQVSVKMALRLNNVPMSEGFAELSQAGGIGAKLALVRRELFPNPAFMGWWSPIARRGRAGLAVAYLWRYGWLAWHAPAGFIAWRRAKRNPHDALESNRP